MRVLTWNVNGSSGLAEDRLASILDAIARLRPDVALLQEVAYSKDVPAKLAAGFASRGLTGFHLPEPVQTARHGSAIVACGSIRSAPLNWIRVEFPQLVACAEVEYAGHQVTVVSAHIPNGSNHGWKKIDHFKALATELESRKGRALVLGGDFNEPQFEKQDGRIVTWGQERGPDGRFVVEETWKDKTGRTGTGAEWDAGVRSVLDDDNRGGLIDVERTLRGSTSGEATHVNRGNPRPFDHLLASRHVRPTRLEFEHEWRTTGLSDHSALWADFEFVT